MTGLHSQHLSISAERPTGTRILPTPFPLAGAQEAAQEKGLPGTNQEGEGDSGQRVSFRPRTRSRATGEYHYGWTPLAQPGM